MHHKQKPFQDDEFVEILTLEEDSEHQHKEKPYSNDKIDKNFLRSHFNDEEFYVPLKKNSFCLDQEGEIQQDMYFCEINSPLTNRQEVVQQQEVINSETQIEQQSIFNQSLYTQKIFEKKIEYKQIHKKIEDKSEIISQSFVRAQRQQTIIPIQNIQYHEQPISLCIKNIPSKSAPKEHLIKLLLKGRQYFLEYEGGPTIKINSESLKDLHDQFFKLEMFVPMFTYERYNQWANSNIQNKYDKDYEPHKLFTIALQKYISFLNFRYYQQFLIVLKSLSSIPLKRKESRLSGIFSIDFNYILQYIRQVINISKTQILRKALISKTRSLNEAIKCSQMWPELIEKRHQLVNVLQETWNNISQLQLLICLQNTELYCTKKIQQNPELKFKQLWKRYRENIKNDIEQQLCIIDKISI